MMNKNIQDILQRETQRQDTTIELIASENFASDEVMDLCGSAVSYTHLTLPTKVTV